MRKDHDFLIKDFEHWAKSYYRNEEVGERRLAFFVGVITAVLGGLAFLAKKGDTIELDPVRGIGAGATCALAALGLLTLLRIVRRNAATDGYLYALASIRDYLGPQHLVEQYTAKLMRGRSIWSGGLAQMVAFVNSGLFALSAWLGLASVLDAVLVFFAAALFQIALLIPWLDRRARVVRVPNTFRPNVGLLVSSGRGQLLALKRRDHPSWQFPQGGIEEHEAPADAAWRELREETGLGEGDVELVREASHWMAYELPEAARSSKTGRGQAQKWVLFRVRSPQAMARVRPGEEAGALAWKSLAEIIDGAVEFRRPVYEALAREFAEELAPRAGEREAAG